VNKALLLDAMGLPAAGTNNTFKGKEKRGRRGSIEKVDRKEVFN